MTWTCSAIPARAKYAIFNRVAYTREAFEIGRIETKEIILVRSFDYE